MTELTCNEMPDLKPRLTQSFISGFISMLAVMLALPLMQRIAMPRDPNIPVDTDPGAIPVPDEFKVPPPPPVRTPDKEIELVENKPLPLDLDYLTVILNPDLGSYSSTDWGIPAGFGTSIEDMIHTIGELTDPPHPIRRTQPVYPLELKRQGIEGTVVVMFIVRSDGRVTNIEIERSTHPAFSEAVLKSVRKWFFEPGEKDGRAVHTRVRQEIPFRIHP